MAGHEVAWQVERDAYRRAVLERWWPGLPRHTDARNLPADLPRVDLLAAELGSPTWSEACPVVVAAVCLRPPRVAVELSSGHVELVDYLCQALQALGYRTGGAVVRYVSAT